ncbi:MAG: hypothetical protein ABI865_09920 [Nitrosospira sp.]
MKNVIDMLGFKVNKIGKWLSKSNKPKIRIKTRNASIASAPALLKEPRSSSKSRQHLRVVK